MKRRNLIIISLAIMGTVSGTAVAAFVATTSTGTSFFSTHVISSRPTIITPRITTDPACGPGVPADTVRQAGSFYACVQSATDASGITSLRADLSSIAAGADNVPLATVTNVNGYAYRSAQLSAKTPTETGTSDTYDVKATNGNGDSATLYGNPFNIRSYGGQMTGEFGAPGSGVAQYYRLNNTSGTTAANAGTAGTATLTYSGGPTQGVPGALVGSSDLAVRLDGAAQYLRAPRTLDVTNDYSVEIWVKGTATSGSGPGAVWSDSAGLMDAGNASSDSDFGVAVDATGRIVAGCGNPGSTIRSAAGALTDAAWHHVVFTRADTSGAIALYLDGASVATASTCSPGQQGGTIWYGRSHESDKYLAADLDEAAIYSTPLSPAAVLDHYKLGKGTG